jgi:hypothetical protein
MQAAAALDSGWLRDGMRPRAVFPRRIEEKRRKRRSPLKS